MLVLICHRQNKRLQSVKEMQNRPQNGSHMVQIRLLGLFAIRLASGEEIKVTGRKDRALLAYLAIHLGNPVSRDRLVEFFWPNAAEGAGRANLRQSLSTLRKTLQNAHGPAISADRDSIWLNADIVATDVFVLETALQSNESLTAYIPEIDGTILDGLASASAAYDTWRTSEISRLIPLVVEVLTRKAKMSLSIGQTMEAAQFLAQALMVDPLAEGVTRRLMKLLSHSGRPEAALRHYHALEAAMEVELGVRPDPRTQELATEIRASRTRRVGKKRVQQAKKGPDGLESGNNAPRSIEETIGLNFTIPEYPSIAVLPFAVMSGDADQEFFAEGVAEEINVALSKISRLLVVARTSTLIYKGQAVDVRQVSNDQGVRYVLEGSVRKNGDRVRVTAQLIDATTGMHLWAERYDRKLADIFAVQDEIVREIVTALDVQLREGEQHRVWSRGTTNLEAWECVRLATDGVLGGSAEAQPRATELIERALALDPGYAIAWAMRGWLYFTEADVGGGLGNQEQFDRAQEAAFRCGNRALEIDPNCADAMGMLALTHLNAGAHDQALEMSERAIAIAPNNAELLGGVASAVMRKSGHPERGAALVKKAMRLCPFYRPGLLRALANNYMGMGRLEEAVACYRESLKRETGYLAPYVNLASSLGLLQRLDEAKKAASEVLRQEPEFSIAAYCKGLSYRNPADIERIADGLRIAGLPQ